MVKEFIEKWWKYKDNMETYFRYKDDISYIEYEDIMKALINNVINRGVSSVGLANKIVIIDDGDRQGAEIFIIHNDIYQPTVEDYFFTHNYYGSCSGCDTLLSITSGKYRPANEEEIKELMQIAFDLLRNIKPFVPDAKFDYGFVHLTEEDE